MDKKKIFLIDFKFFVLGNGQLFEKTKHGRLIYVDNLWLYVIGTRKEDLDALLALVASRKCLTLWTLASVAVEAKDVADCLNIFLSYVRCGYNCQKEEHVRYCTFIDQRLMGLKPNLDISFQNWPIKIEKITTFPNCSQLNEKWKKKGVLVCNEVEDILTEIDICSIACTGSGLDDGDCLPSAYIWRKDKIISIEQKMDICGQKFILEEVSFRR